MAYLGRSSKANRAMIVRSGRNVFAKRAVVFATFRSIMEAFINRLRIVPNAIKALSGLFRFLLKLLELSDKIQSHYWTGRAQKGAGALIELLIWYFSDVREV